MNKDNLFELIRKEEVVIWAGAGLSLYAGYPSGGKLVEILINTLSKSEKLLINHNLLLPDLAEEYFRLKANSKNALIKILRQTFIDKIPDTTECHNSIATIPHFKTIITTNYDKLIESSFGTKAQVVLSSKHIPYLEKNKTHIFKVHGDLLEPDSIIITKSDYNNFFKKNSQEDLYWTVIKERLSTNSILFLGYNLEDPNISVIFDKISEELGEHRKECFFVSPDLAQHKINDLIRKGIHYINLTAEELIKELIFNIKDNIIEDLEKGHTSADTFNNFLTNINLLPDLKSVESKYKLQSLRGSNDKVEGNINLTFKNNPEFINELNQYLKGDKIGTFNISAENLLNVDLRYAGVKLINPDGIYKLEFKPIPKIDTIIDIRFETGSEYTDIPVKVYFSSLTMEAHIELKNAVLIFNFDLSTLPHTKFKLNYEHREICTKVKDEIEIFELLTDIGNGKEFTIFIKSGESFSSVFPTMPSLLEDSRILLEYFNNLKIIEQYYKIRFSNINIYAINNLTINKVACIIKSIKAEVIECIWQDELTMEIVYNEKTINKLKIMNEVNAPLTVHYNEEEIIELHGHNINLGFKKVDFLESYVINLESIIDKKETQVKIKGRSNKMLVSYTKTNGG